MDGLLSKENIYSLVGQEELMRKYFPGNVARNRKIKSPFRVDGTGNCYFNWTRRGNFIFFDHTDPSLGGDAVSILMITQRLTFREALLKINEDYTLGLKTHLANNMMTPLREKVRQLSYLERLEKSIENFKRVHYKVEARQWSSIDGKYWKDRYGVSCSLLIKYNVIPVYKYYTRFWDQKVFKLQYTHTDENPCYCAKIKENEKSSGVKIYKPLTNDPDDKWGSNVAYDAIYGWEQLPEKGDLVIIASSLKDLLVLVALGYNAIAPMSEAAKIPASKIKELKERFTRVVVLYDLDSAGIENARALCLEHELLCGTLPDKNNRAGKDISDDREQYGEDETRNIMAEVIRSAKYID